MRRTIALASIALLLSACAGGTPGARVATATSDMPAPAPDTRSTRGLEGVLGASPQSLTRQFGEARIDLSEGEARKLQFVSERCVLDVFLYPTQSRGEPVATHVEARERTGGQDTDRARCIAEVAMAARSR